MKLIQLGRMGDLINVLPLCRKYEWNLISNVKYVKLLSGCDWLKYDLLSCDELDLREAAQRTGLPRIVTQIGSNTTLPPVRICSNWQREQYRLAGHLDEYYSIKREDLFRRDFQREKVLIDSIGKNNILLSLTGISSPLPKSTLEKIKEAFPTAVDIGSLNLEYPYDLIGVIEASRLVITADSFCLHLMSQCPKIPYIAFLAEQPTYAGSTPFGNCLSSCTYSEIPFLLEEIISTVKKSASILIKRSGAFGDVFLASVVVNKLTSLGYSASLQCSEEIKPTMKYSSVTFGTGADIIVDLDGCYESVVQSPIPLYDFFHYKTAAILADYGILIGKSINKVPILKEIVPADISAEHPLIGICPGSNSWANKKIDSTVLAKLPGKTKYTLIWLGQTKAPRGYLDLHIKSFEQLLTVMAACDVIVTTDTGPLHAAAALNKPIVAIEQAYRINLRLTDQTDYCVVHADLPCIGCNKQYCPIDIEKPPCQMVKGIEQAIELKLPKKDSVSAIIPCYKPGKNIRKAISHVLPQVSEVVVSLDGSATFVCKEVIVIPSLGKRTGCSRTSMRAVRHTTSEWVLFLNDDCFLHADAVACMLEVTDPTVAVVGAQLWYPNGTIQHGGGYREPGSCGFGHLDHKAKVGTITRPTELEFVTLAAALIRRKAFFEVRGYDERFDCYCEDADFCLSVRQKGWKVIYQPKAKGIHIESVSTTPDEKLQFIKISSQLLADKWEWYFEKNKHNSFGTF